MANWCSTSYTFEGNKDEITDLFQKLKVLEQMPTPFLESDFGNLWLGCVINLFGGNWEKIDCRGYITDFELNKDGILTINTETTWQDFPEVWDFVTEQYPSISFYYIAEESGCGYFVTNDVEGKYYPMRFQIDQDDTVIEYYIAQNEVLIDISNRLGITLSNWEEMERVIKEFNTSHEDEFINVNVFKVIK